MGRRVVSRCGSQIFLGCLTASRTLRSGSTASSPRIWLVKIPFDLDEQSATDEKGFDRVTVEALDANLLVPSTLHDACDANGVVTVALVDLHLQSRFRVPSIDADNRKLHFIQLGPQPC